jgi:hypothetical protein
MRTNRDVLEWHLMVAATAVAVLFACGADAANVFVEVGATTTELTLFGVSAQWDMTYFEEALTQQGGLPMLSGDRVFFNFTVMNEGFFDVDRMSAIYTEFCERGVHFYLAPFGSAMTIEAAKLLYDCRARTGNQLVMITPNANSRTLRLSGSWVGGRGVVPLHRTAAPPL